MASDEKPDATVEDFAELFNFKGGDKTFLVTYKGKRTIAKVASQSMALASPVKSHLIIQCGEYVH